MSAFSDHSCCGPMSGRASSAALIEYANEYKNLLGKLTDHINDEVSASEDVHNVKAYVQSVKESIDEVLKRYVKDDDAKNTYVSKEQFNVADTVSHTELDTLLSSKASSLDFNDLVDEVKNLSYVSPESLENYVTVEDFTELSKAHTALVTALESYKVSSRDLYGVANYKEFKPATAFYAGTGSVDTGTKGLWLFAQISDSAFKDTASIVNKQQSGTIYIKFMNTNDLDAIINFTATNSETGTLAVAMSKAAEEEIRFHLVHGTTSNDKDHLYLGISAESLSTMTLGVQVKVAGNNVYVQGDENFELPNGHIKADVCTVVIPEGVKSCFAASNVSAKAVHAAAFYDQAGKLFAEIIKNPETKDTQFVFKEHPCVLVDEENDPVVTKSAVPNTVPVGAMLRWAGHDEDLLPNTYMFCDGRQLIAKDYFDLAVALGVISKNTDINELQDRVVFDLPIEDFSIIKVKKD